MHSQYPYPAIPENGGGVNARHLRDIPDSESVNFEGPETSTIWYDFTSVHETDLLKINRLLPAYRQAFLKRRSRNGRFPGYGYTRTTPLSISRLWRAVGPGQSQADIHRMEMDPHCQQGPYPANVLFVSAFSLRRPFLARHSQPAKP